MHHDLPDKILAAAHGKIVAQGDGAGLSDDESKRSSRKRPRYEDPSSEEDGDDPQEGDGDTSASISEDDDSDDGIPVKRWIATDMGQKGEPFTEADMYMVAKHIAEHPNWEQATHRERWEAFAEKV